MCKIYPYNLKNFLYFSANIIYSKLSLIQKKNFIKQRLKSASLIIQPITTIEINSPKQYAGNSNTRLCKFVNIILKKDIIFYYKKNCLFVNYIFQIGIIVLFNTGLS